MNLYNATGFTHAIAFGTIATILTISFKSSLKHEMEVNDYIFIFGTMAVVYYHRWQRSNIENMEHILKYKNLNIKAPLLNNIEKMYWLQKVEGEILLDQKIDQATIVLFFATYCEASRAAMLYMKDIVAQMPNVHVIGLTQEVREEIEAYETLGVEAKYFHSLKDIGFSIGIEDGGMYKAFQIEHGVGTYPHCYVVDNQSTIIWHGHPLDAAFKEQVSMAIQSKKGHRDKNSKL